MPDGGAWSNSSYHVDILGNRGLGVVSRHANLVLDDGLAMCQPAMMEPKHPLAVWREAQTPPLSQEDCAKRCKVTRWTINSLETGRRRPSIDLIRAVVALTDGAVGFAELTVAA